MLHQTKTNDNLILKLRVGFRKSTLWHKKDEHEGFNDKDKGNVVSRLTLKEYLLYLIILKGTLGPI